MARSDTDRASGEPPRASGRFAYSGLDRLIHERARLGIVACLAAHPQGLLFSDLKEFCVLTDGNLSRHLHSLQEAGLVQIWKGFRSNRPQTLCVLTETGRKRFVDYVSVLERVVADAQAAAVPSDSALADPAAVSSETEIVQAAGSPSRAPRRRPSGR